MNSTFCKYEIRFLLRRKEYPAVLLMFSLFLLSACICMGECTNCTPLNLTGLVGWWPANGNAGNVVNMSAATIDSNVTFASGKVSQAFDLNGGTVNAGNFSGLSNAAALTIMAWINYGNTNTNNEGSIVGQGDRSSGAWVFSVEPVGGGGNAPVLLLYLKYSDEGWEYITSHQNVVPVGQWTHVAVTWRSSDGIAKFYFNGSNVDNLPAGATKKLANPQNLPLIIGQAGSYHGLIDEVKVFNRALSAADIQSIYSADCSGVCLPIRIIQRPQNQILFCGSNVTFSVSATNDFGYLNYQWQFNGTNVLGGTNSALILTNITTSQAGIYTVLISGVPNSQSLSASATLTFSFLQLNRYAGVTLFGEPGNDYRIEYTDNLTPPLAWTVLTNITMVSTSYLHFDSTSANTPMRFYRAVSASCP